MRLRTQFAALVATAVLLGAGALATLAWAVRETRDVNEAQQQALTIAREVTGLLLLTQDYLLYGEPRAQQQWRARYRRLDEAFAAARSGRIGREGRLEASEQLQLLPELFDELQRLPGGAGATPLDAKRRELAVDRLLTAAQALVDHAYERERDITGRRDRSERRLMALAVVLPALLALLFALAGAVLARQVLRPLALLRASMDAVAAGEPLKNGATHARDELGALARRFERLAGQLAQRDSALRASESMLRQVTDNLPAMIGYWDRDCRNRFANADYLRWFGKSPAQIQGRTIEELLGPELYAKNKPYIDGALAGRRQDFDREIPGPDGVLRYSQASYIPDVHEGRVDGFFVLVTDVSDRVRGEQALAKALAEKETLLKEVYHRVKNNLQVVQSLLNLQSRTVRDNSARSALREMAQRVAAMALVHEQLYNAPSLDGVPLPQYVADLARQLVASGERATGEVRLQTDVAPLQIGLDAAIPLGLLLTELITNSFKHGFPAGRGGSIHVRISAVDGGVRIVVSDDGQGLPTGFSMAASRTLGLQLASSLARQLDGELHVEPGPGGGTTAWLQVPHL